MKKPAQISGESGFEKPFSGHRIFFVTEVTEALSTEETMTRKIAEMVPKASLDGNRRTEAGLATGGVPVSEPQLLPDGFSQRLRVFIIFEKHCYFFFFSKVSGRGLTVGISLATISKFLVRTVTGAITAVAAFFPSPLHTLL